MAAAKKKRRDTIVELTRQQRHVSVEVLADQLGVSAQTIRRDINKLCELNILRRRHGGAELFERQLAKEGKAPRTAALPFPRLAFLAHFIMSLGIGIAIGGFTVFMVFLIVNKLLHLI